MDDQTKREIWVVSLERLPPFLCCKRRFRDHQWHGCLVRGVSFSRPRPYRSAW
jgi:hypothetical protein